MAGTVFRPLLQVREKEMLFKTFAVSETKLAEGIEIKYSTEKNADGTVPSFRIMRKDVRLNKRYAKALEEESRPYRRMIDTDNLSFELNNELNLKCFCRGILIGWENIQDENGKVIPFSFENAMFVMQKLPDLYADLEAQASKAAMFKDEQMEADAKN
jgi:hypothetical protein